MSRASSEKAEQLMKKLGLKFNHILAMRFAVNVGISTWIVWTILKLLGLSNPVWAIVSTIACSDPQPKEAGKMFKGRLINAIVGCSIGLFFIWIGGSKEWILPVAMATTVLISSLLIRIKAMWLQAPITAALVIASAIGDPTNITAMNNGLRRVEDVIIGSCVGITISWIMSKVWFIQHHTEEASPIGPMQD